jgi:transposase
MKYFKCIDKFVENKMVFCGIDIHKHHWNLCYYSDGEVVEKLRINGLSKRLLGHTESHYSTARNIHFVYEAGFSGFHLYRNLKDSGYPCTITPPNRVLAAHDKVKTDKRDAQKLAQLLASGLLKKVFVPPLSSEADRQLLRLRNSYQKKLTRVKNQIKSHLHLHGLTQSPEHTRKWTKRYIQWLEGLEFKEPNLRFILDHYLLEYHFHRNQIADLTKRIRELSRTDAYQIHFKRLVACKGIGLITAMTFLLELHDIIRFPSAAKFSSYLGLTPSQYSSGNHVRLGHITREGNSHLRRVLIESAWTVIRHDPFLKEKYGRIRAKGTNGKKAIVAVARSLAVRLRRCLLDEVSYETGIC